MSINISNSSSATFKMQPKKSGDDDNISDGSVLKINEVSEKAPSKVRVGVAITTLAGIATAMYSIFKMHKLPMENLKDYFANFKKIKYESECWKCADNIKRRLETAVAILGASSVGAGLLGGLIFDKKENRKAKIRESIIQLIGNIGTPLACVSVGMGLFDKYLNKKIINTLKLTSEKTKKIPGLIASGVILVAAIIAGNKVGNFINKKVFDVDDNRKLKLSDMSPHIDDAALAFTIATGSETISKFVPAALTIAGYSAGTAQEKPKILEEAKEKEYKKQLKKQFAMQQSQNA